MVNITAKHFNGVEYMQRLKKVKFTDEQAEILAKETEDLISNVLEHAKEQAKSEFESKDLATKGDVRESELRLQKEIKSLEVKLLYLYGTGFVVLLGVLAKGFHWI
jgi:hypothetical protein